MASNNPHTIANRKWQLANPERIKEYKRLDRIKHREKRLEDARRWKRNNPERHKELKRLSYARHRDETLERNRKKRLGNRDERNAKARAEYAENKNGRRDKSNAYSRAQRATPEFKVYRREYWLAHRVERVIYDVRKRCKARILDTDLDFQWVREKFAGVCELSGLPFDMDNRRGPNSPSVDRIDPNGPYTKDNCRMILWFINRAMSNYGQDYVFDVFLRVLKNRGIVP